MLTINRVLSALVGACALAVAAPAQSQGEGGRGPAEPARPFVVLPAQSLADLERRLRPEAQGEDLHGGPGAQLRVAVLHERNRPATEAEVHDASDDVYYVLEGTAMLTLGGRLEAAREAESGEWRAPRISGGQTFEIRKGDLIVVPRGTPHMRSTAGKDFSMILIKVWAAPLPASPPTAAPAGARQKP